MKSKKKLKERILGMSGGFAGVLSFLGGYQVCHNICMGLIALLTFFGVAVAGMPLLFLTKVAVPFWIAAVSMLAIMLVLSFRKVIHPSKKMLLLNSGLIIAGVPFQSLQNYNIFFWIIGGIIIASSIAWYFYDKYTRK